MKSKEEKTENLGTSQSTNVKNAEKVYANKDNCGCYTREAWEDINDLDGELDEIFICSDR